MRHIVKAAVAAFAVLFGLGLGLAGGTAAQADQDGMAKREDDVREVVAVDDDGPDDDSNATSRSGAATSVGSRTGGSTADSRDASGDSNDRTNSRNTAVSRDRDLSRGDLTRDVTRDGGDRTRDWSENRTNDRSRNDTR